jgi:hypothetical protein
LRSWTFLAALVIIAAAQFAHFRPAEPELLGRRGSGRERDFERRSPGDVFLPLDSGRTTWLSAPGTIHDTRRRGVASELRFLPWLRPLLAALLFWGMARRCFDPLTALCLVTLLAINPTLYKYMHSSRLTTSKS